MKKEFKLYFVDLDGTLLDIYNDNGKPTISVKNLDAIRKAQSANKEIVISTGRLGANAKPFLKLLNASHAVLGNGAQVMINKEIAHEYKLSVKDILLFREMAQKLGLSFKLDDSNEAWGTFGAKQKIITKMLNFVPLASYNFNMEKEYFKIVCWGFSKTTMREMHRVIKDKFPHLTAVTSAHGWTIEITHGEATKGKGNELIAKYLQIDKELTAHVGDTMNDSTAKGHVGALIAMKNGDKGLKKIADYLGPSHKKAGVAKVLDGHIRQVKEK